MRQVLQVLAANLGGHLPQQHLACARLVCKDWSQGLLAGCKTAELTVAPVSLAFTKSRLEQMRRLMPGLETLTLRLSNRVNSYWHCCSALPMLAEEFTALKALTLDVTSPPDPKNFTVQLLLLDSLSGFSGLQSLTYRACKMPTPFELCSLSQLGGLTSLVFDTWSERNGNMDGSSGCANSDHIEALATLTRLKRLEVAVSADDGQEMHAPMAAMTGLTTLVLKNKPVSDSFMKDLARMTGLKVADVTIGSESSLLDYTQGLARWSHKSSVSLTLQGRETLHDTGFMTHRLRHRLTSLTLGGCTLDSDTWEKLAGLTGLKSLSLDSVGPSIKEVGFDDPATLLALSALSELTSFKCRSAFMQAVGRALPWLLKSWPQLRVLHLVDLGSEDLPGPTLTCLRHVPQLEELHILAPSTSKAQVLLDMRWLPHGLQRLRARHVYMPCPLHHERLLHLQELSLNSCTYGCCGHLKAALCGLHSLTSLELDEMPQLRDSHLGVLAGLTGLTALSLRAMGNHHIGCGSIMHVSSLLGLRSLRWHVGDLLDFPPNPAALQPLTRLATLDVPANTYWRMQRWSVTDVLEHMPSCEVFTSA